MRFKYTIFDWKGGINIAQIKEEFKSSEESAVEIMTLRVALYVALNSTRINYTTDSSQVRLKSVNCFVRRT